MKCSWMVIFFLLTFSQFAEDPQRIVSFSPSTTEILFALGAGDNVVGVTSYCNYPDEVRRIPKIGGYFSKTINLEAVVLLEPDLVICEEAAHADMRSKLEDLGIRYLYVRAQYYDDIFINIREIGNATGYISEALKLTKDLKRREKAIIEKVSVYTKRPSVFWEIWDVPLMSAGPESFIGKSIQIAGGSNIFADADQEWPQVNLETLIARNPDIIIVSNSHGGTLTVKDIMNRNNWENLTAVKSNSVYLIDEDIFSRPSPRIIAGIETLERLFHPEGTSKQ